MARFLSSPLGRWLLLSLGLYLVTFALGLEVSQGVEGEASRSFIRASAQVLGPLARLEPPQMMAAIFLNNSIKALAVIALGFTLGAVPFVFVAVNGLITGLVVGEVGKLAGLGLALAAVAPHGVVEIPALLLAAALGFRVAGAVMGRMAGREGSVGRELRRGLALYLKVVLPALLVGAAVEAFVTPGLVGR